MKTVDLPLYKLNIAQITFSATLLMAAALPVDAESIDSNPELPQAASEVASQTPSKRINVYSLTQNYRDTRSGDTLGEIASQLLPNNPAKRILLMLDILQLNPEAFIDGDPDKLLAGKRLWMPGYMKQADTKVDPETTSVETFSWGNIKRQK